MLFIDDCVFCNQMDFLLINILTFFSSYIKVTEDRNEKLNSSESSKKTNNSMLRSSSSLQNSDFNSASVSPSRDLSGFSGGHNIEMNMSQQMHQQQVDASPISTQLNKVLKKAKKDTEKKMLLNDEDFS